MWEGGPLCFTPPVFRTLQLIADFPSLRCYAFSPPGAVASAALAAAMEPFCMSPLVRGVLF